jgi:1-deoxy-D-xylulose-5-phosphate reductoisomerase
MDGWLAESIVKDRSSPKRIVVLGSTGSIGIQTLDVVRAHPERFRVAGLCCHSRTGLLRKQIAEFRPSAVAVTGPVETGTLAAEEGVSLYAGEEGLCSMLAECEADIVVNGIAGSSGLLPSIRALEAGRDLALANKETIVMAGPLMTKLAASHGARILPVDSEHSALFSILRLMERESVDEVFITASGGALRDRPLDELPGVQPEDALKHPTWSMGPKITIDSATLANKGLEVIEAMYLFKMSAEQIKVLIHPQSYVHAMVRTKEKSLYAQISNPNMRVPIQNALSYPDLFQSPVEPLDLAGKALTFSPWNESRYPLLKLAYRVCGEGGVLPIVYNAANEVAVGAFLSHRISFPAIAEIVERSVESNGMSRADTIEDIISVHEEAKRQAEQQLGGQS